MLKHVQRACAIQGKRIGFFILARNHDAFAIAIRDVIRRANGGLRIKARRGRQSEVVLNRRPFLGQRGDIAIGRDNETYRRGQRLIGTRALAGKIPKEIASLFSAKE